MTIEGLGPGTVLGDLRLRDRGATCEGTLALSLVDRPPAPLLGCRRDDGVLSFRAAGDVPLAFVVLAVGARLGGTVTRPGEPPARWIADPIAEQIEFYPSAPRFTLAQVTGGAFEEARRLPGPLVAAARRGEWRAELDRAYADAAGRAGVPALPADRLVADGPRRVRALADRAAVLAASQRALERIRALLPAEERSIFDRTFRVRNGWRVELHQAAFGFARLRVPDLTWAEILGALRAPAPADLDAETAAVRAVEALRASGDSGAMASLLAEARRASTRDARVLAALVEAYAAAEAWHREALRTLLALHWVPAGGGRRSPAELVREGWAAAAPDDAARADSLPRLESRRFAGPQAVPRYGTPAALRRRLVRADNWSAQAWLERHGTETLLEVLQRLDWPALQDVTLAEGREPIRLVSVPARARESMNGFLAPQDAIVVEPGWVPVLALATVVHEWVHLLYEGRRVERLVAGMPDGAGAPLDLPPADPWLAEGLAESWSDALLAPAVAAVPLVGVSEREQRARLARAEPDDPHVLGYLVVERALASGGAGRGAIARLLDAPDLAAVARDPALAAAWAPHRGAPDLQLPNPSRRFLVPETTFTVQDLVPDPVHATIRSRD
jgi:hypothetical protein